MKFKEYWPKGYRGEVVQRCERTDKDGRQVITIAHPEPCSGELQNCHWTSQSKGNRVSYFLFF